MRALTALAAAAAVLAVALPAAAKPGQDLTCTGTGRVRTCDVPLPGDVQVRSSKVNVVLPAGYDTSGRDYPVVYVLHGVGDDYASWTGPSRGDLATLTKDCDAIFVTPDGGGGTNAGWYSDWLDGSYQYETFHTQVLPKAIDRAFRTEGRRERAIAGLSMGGFGALSYAARHPGMYRAAASYSGFVDTTFGAPASGQFYEYGGQNPVYSFGSPSTRIWGDQTSNADVWAAHNPYDQAAHLAGTPLYLSSGTGTPGGAQGDDPNKAPNYLIEAYVRQLNDRLATRLTDLKIPFTDARETGGYHDWSYWRFHFRDSLRVLMPALDAANPGCGA